MIYHLFFFDIPTKPISNRHSFKMGHCAYQFRYGGRGKEPGSYCDLEAGNDGYCRGHSNIMIPKFRYKLPGGNQPWIKTRIRPEWRSA